MKKRLILLLATALLLTACAPHDQPEQTDAAPSQTVTTTASTSAPPTSQATKAPTQAPTETQAPAPVGWLAVRLSLVYEGTVYGPYTRLKPDTNLQGCLDSLQGVEIEAPDLSGVTYWYELTWQGENWTVYPTEPVVTRRGEGEDAVYYSTEGYSRVYRIVFSTLENECQPRVTAAGDTPEAALEDYAANGYPALLARLNPLSTSACRDYELLGYQVTYSEDGYLEGSFTFSGIVDEEFFPFSLEGLDLGMGEQEGKNVFTGTLALERHGDGYWYPIPIHEREALGRDYSSNDPASMDLTAPEAVQAAQLLDGVPAGLRAYQTLSADDPRQALINIAGLFRSCVLAAPLAGQPDFDFGVFCTPEALTRYGMRSLIHRYVNIPASWVDGNLSDPGSFPDVFLIQGDQAIVSENDITIYFLRGADGVWQVDDVTLPWILS